MAVTITAEAMHDQGRVLVEVRDDAADLDPATAVERDDGGGYRERRYATVLDTARHKVWADYECPLDVDVTYRVVGTSLTAAARLDSGGETWWKPLPYPSLGMRVNVASYLADAVSETETVDVFPLGAEYPVTVSGVRRAERGTVAVHTLTRADETRFRDGLRRSPVVLLQAPGGDQTYLTVRQVSRTRPRRLGEPWRLWSMDCQVRDAPPVVWAYPGTATWASYDTEATWAQWRTGGSWLDVLLGV